MTRIKPITGAMLLGGLLGLMGAPLAQAAEYTLVRGERWQGVQIGGEAPRSRDSICRDSHCYLLKSHRPPATAEISHYRLRDVRFQTLARLPDVTRAGEDRLRLPADLGQALFLEARLDYWRSQRRRGED